MKYCQRLPISYLLLVLIPALVVPFAYSDDKKKAAQQNRSANQAKSSEFINAALESRLDPMTSKNRPSRFVVLLVAALSALLYSDKPAAGTEYRFRTTYKPTVLYTHSNCPPVRGFARRSQ
jgi:hypothetical protein